MLASRTLNSVRLQDLMPSQGGNKVMFRNALPNIMMSNVDPRYLRLCLPSSTKVEETTLLKKEMGGASFEKSDPASDIVKFERDDRLGPLGTKGTSRSTEERPGTH